MIDAFGSLGLWLNRRPVPVDPDLDLAPPPGGGPLILIAAAEPDGHSSRSVVSALCKSRPDLRIAMLGRDGLPAAGDDTAAAAIDILRPAVVLLLGQLLPAGLIETASRWHIPVVLADSRIIDMPSRFQLRGAMRAAMQRQLLRQITLLLLADPASRDAAIAQGVPQRQIRVTGPVTETRDPMTCVEAERAHLALMLQGRHVWLAAALPENEEQAMIDAHRAALRYSHRALLIVVPDRRDRGEALAALLEQNGFTVALRSAEEEPTGEIQILVADDPAEMGLWYRLAPVTWMGGTLSGASAEPRHPFEPAALGSAVIHGPETAPFAAEMGQLDGAGATRAVADSAGLAEAVADLAQPDVVARLAASAWSVSTGGAGVAQDIAAPVLSLIAARKG